METELWPNLLHECRRRGVPVVLASARLTAKSVSRYRRFGGLFRGAVASSRIIAAQSAEDAERFIAIGADPERTHVIGNVKFDMQPGRSVLEQGRELRTRYARREAGMDRGQHPWRRGGAAARRARRAAGEVRGRLADAGAAASAALRERGELAGAAGNSLRPAQHRPSGAARGASAAGRHRGRAGGAVCGGRCGIRRRKPGAGGRAQSAGAGGARRAGDHGPLQCQQRRHRPRAGARRAARSRSRMRRS